MLANLRIVRGEWNSHAFDDKRGHFARSCKLATNQDRGWDWDIVDVSIYP